MHGKYPSQARATPRMPITRRAGVVDDPELGDAAANEVDRRQAGDQQPEGAEDLGPPAGRSGTCHQNDEGDDGEGKNGRTDGMAGIGVVVHEYRGGAQHESPGNGVRLPTSGGGEVDCT